ncbi:MAG: UDP-N-acetylglucosamine 1-carboxyvinyltransferase [Bdellovibrionales bacterium]|nr:UDP-N-acetylglucosamine 1-carboxyvinyltransferase [Bdellovibrionales bacterium]
MKVVGGRPLMGTVQISGAKNAALPLLFSSLLAEGEHVFHNVPRLMDIRSTAQLLEHLGCETEHIGSTFRILVRPPKSFEAPYDLVRKMRASILCLGPLLAKYGQAKVSLPGGCAIGTRPIDLHLEGLKLLGAQLELENGYVLGTTKRLKGNMILFESPTVGGTENLMMAACLAEGETTIENAAKEPEIVDLANYLIRMGAQISGAGSSIIKIKGVSKLKPATHTVIADRIETGTLLIAAALTKGDVTLTQCVPTDLDALIAKLKESGFELECSTSQMRIKPCARWSGVDLTTAPHPAFPTDLQAQFMALMTLANGTSVITETVFENRFMHVQELVRLGADITPKTRVAVVRGVKALHAAPVMATDLRASACLVLAGLAAQGETVVGRIYHLDRGYEGMDLKLKSLGAQIVRSEN